MTRLQRSDLSKEFSQIVQQEIINHNKCILASNVLIDEIKSELDCIKKILDKKTALIQSQISEHSLVIENIVETSVNAEKNIKTEFNELRKYKTDQLECVKKSICDRESYFLRVEGFSKFKEALDRSIANIERMFHEQKDNLRQSYNTIVDLIDRKIEDFKSCFDKKVVCDAKERNDIDKRLDAIVMNHEGTKTEIENIKKRCFVIEKNIENLHTRIDRLKDNR